MGLKKTCRSVSACEQVRMVGNRKTKPVGREIVIDSQFRQTALKNRAKCTFPWRRCEFFADSRRKVFHSHVLLNSLNLYLPLPLYGFPSSFRLTETRIRPKPARHTVRLALRTFQGLKKWLWYPLGCWTSKDKQREILQYLLDIELRYWVVLEQYHVTSRPQNRIW